MDSRTWLRSSVARAGHALSDVVTTAAGMSGLFLSRLNPPRLVVSLTIGLFGALLLSADFSPGLGFALPFCALLFAARHVFLFVSFRPGGVAERLKRRFGNEAGFAIYEATLALLLFAQRLGFFWLVVASAGNYSGTLGAAFMSSGALLIALGASVSVWASSTLGLDTYYYRDLFLGQRHASFELAGPYAFLHSPQYGVGQLAAYGLALAAGSPLGLLAAGLNQAALLAFNRFVEQPHLRAAARLSVDAELRETLARTVNELDATYTSVGGTDWAAYAASAARSAKRLQPPPPRAR